MERRLLPDIAHRINALKPWFHNFDISGIRTRPMTGNVWSDNYPENLWSLIKHMFDADLTGKKALDIGCDAGGLSFKLAAKGAQVTGIDNSQPVSNLVRNAIKQARFIESIYNLGVEFIDGDFMDDAYLSTYDVILFMGVYYHMKDHKAALPRIKKLLNAGGVLYFETAVEDQRRFYSDLAEDKAIYHDDPTNYFVPDMGYILDDLKSNGFTVYDIGQV